MACTAVCRPAVPVPRAQTVLISLAEKVSEKVKRLSICLLALHGGSHEGC